jgi:protein-L-isoaspartate(D-aspartate) O-methyltransferase
MSDLPTQLRERMVADLDLSADWQRAFERVPRHVFVPRITSMSPIPDGVSFPITAKSNEELWLRLVYSNEALYVTDDVSGERRSSSSSPSAMARFLQLLDVEDDTNVLEIGTGTGYNAALLCERLGSEHVTTIDMDADLVSAARYALASCGYRPTVAQADGFYGYLPRAPYDRIVATCSVARVPASWRQQLAPGGLLVVPLHNDMLLSLRRQADGRLEGRAEARGVRFMGLYSPAIERWQWERAEQPIRERPFVRTDVLSAPVGARNYLQVMVPDICFTEDERGLIGPNDGSWARLTDDDVIHQGGPRQLWDCFENAYDEWRRLGEPGWGRFGLTVLLNGTQFVWLDSSESEHRWGL